MKVNYETYHKYIAIHVTTRNMKLMRFQQNEYVTITKKTHKIKIRIKDKIKTNTPFALECLHITN